MQYLRFIIMAYLCSALPVQADIEYIKINSVGFGLTLSAAIGSALEEAIGQVQGRSIDSDTLLLTTGEAVDTSEDASYFSSEKYINKVREQTRGAVSKYDILSSNKNEAGTWEVKLSASVAKYKKSASAGRKRIAVLPLRVSSDAYKISGSNIGAADIRRRFSEALIARLVQTGRFAILDREFTETTQSELNLAASSEVPVEEQARLGEKLVADYVLTGAIEVLYYETSSKNLHITGRTITGGNGYIEIGYRLIDVALQQVAFSDTVKVPVNDRELESIAGVGGGKQAIASSILDAAAEKISKAVTDQIYPMAVLSAKGKNVVIGQGGNGVKTGTRYSVYQRGEKLFDPYTKEYIGRNEIFCCTVEIDRVSPKVSYGHIIENDIDLVQEVEPATYVLREKINVAKAGRRGEEILGGPVGTKKEKHDDDW